MKALIILAYAIFFLHQASLSHASLATINGPHDKEKHANYDENYLINGEFNVEDISSLEDSLAHNANDQDIAQDDLLADDDRLAEEATEKHHWIRRRRRRRRRRHYLSWPSIRHFGRPIPTSSLPGHLYNVFISRRRRYRPSDGSNHYFRGRYYFNRRKYH
ncbi:uncharacterized protein TRIADDRAFT_59517 [Trichoplax adhaerens]|uniref:Uncharacterized protein n=1 Tax=Trichoplax adhaerens TaxID=10228 RepID=B3S5M4_TRIAD|nr:predicted protein [Trichoplax adhaerens]EDV21868.1 predicted protein [Trichoplax adhaerens]|eukprot:XP_002115505.1 predicted protein [Trichoplax adhaerens]